MRLWPYLPHRHLWRDRVCLLVEAGTLHNPHLVKVADEQDEEEGFAGFTIRFCRRYHAIHPEDSEMLDDILWQD